MSLFSERLTATRKEKRFSRQEMADVLEVTVRAYQYYEEGKREPSYDKLTALARCLNVSADYLLGLTDK